MTPAERLATWVAKLIEENQGDAPDYIKHVARDGIRGATDG